MDLNDESIYDQLIRISFIILGIYIGLGVGVTYNVYADDLPYFSNDTAEFVLTLEEPEEIDQYTRVVRRVFDDNGTLTLVIQSEIPQKMKVSLPFQGGAEKYLLQPGENTFLIPMEPRFGQYLYGIHTVNGDAFYSEKVSSLGADYALVITYHELVRNAWKVSFLSLFILIFGLASGVYYRRRAPVRIKSKPALMFFSLVAMCLFIIFTFQYTDGETTTITFTSDRLGEDYRGIYFIPLSIGLIASFSVTMHIPRRVLLFNEMDGLEIDDYTETETGTAMDKWGDLVIVDYVDQLRGQPTRINEADLGPIPLTVDRIKDEIEPEIRKYFLMPNKAIIYIFIAWIILKLLETRLALTIGFPVALFAMATTFGWVNRRQLAIKMALEPVYAVIYQGSKILNADTLVKMVRTAEIKGILEEEKKLIAMVINAKADSNTTILETLGMADDERREILEPTPDSDLFDDMTEEDLGALMREIEEEEDGRPADQ